MSNFITCWKKTPKTPKIKTRSTTPWALRIGLLKTTHTLAAIGRNQPPTLPQSTPPTHWVWFETDWNRKLGRSHMICVKKLRMKREEHFNMWRPIKDIRQEKWHESCALCRIRSAKFYLLWATTILHGGLFQFWFHLV